LQGQREAGAESPTPSSFFTRPERRVEKLEGVTPQKKSSSYFEFED